MDIRQLDRETYAGRRFIARYMTGGYYDICPSDDGFRMEYVSFAAPVEKSFEDVFFGDWLEDPVAFGAFEDGRMIGYAEGSPETWNNRFRISNLCVFDGAMRRRGTGTALMEVMLRTASSSGARMAVLETQSCNENAIAFYTKNGFSVIGFDLYSYSNDDPARHEIRVEMGRKL